MYFLPTGYDFIEKRNEVGALLNVKNRLRSKFGFNT